MRVHDTTDRVERQIEREMRRQVRRRPTLPFHDSTVEIDGDEVALSHYLVRHAARLDHDHSARAIDGARVAECEWREAAARQLDVRLQHLLSDHRHAMPARAFARAITAAITSR